ncbi:MAG TPA: hypothetical protein VMF06_22035 [Candidatus Limnocylindria bacterium]|jgi:hypothetical protein|nr:hypothetical protein [Candidatus Limnocylindria bacterium]
MATRKRTWTEKLADSKDLPKVFAIHPSKAKRWGSGTMLIPAPVEVDAMMRQVPFGRLTTIDEIRRALASRHGATIGCPITTGIFAWIAAHAATEGEGHRTHPATPYWRTLKAKGEINPKYPGGIESLKAKLTEEGHCVIQKGKRFFVKDFSERLFAPQG